ncbi:20967_t:CDS:1, partial [Racocetra persica]
KVNCVLSHDGYSASYIEIEYSNYLYSIFQTMVTLNSKDYKTPNDNYALKQDNYSLAIENIDSYSIYEFQLKTTKMNDAITFNMNKI